MNESHASMTAGALLREWRQRRRFSQLDLAGDAGISTRHLSFVETGRSLPSREMLHRLADRLDLPLRVRNQLLIAAGYAPGFTERPLADPALAAARDAVERVLAAHHPYPALAIDRHWNLLAANDAIGWLLDGVEPALLAPPVNVLRLALHPRGLAPRITNLGEWRAHLLARLQRDIDNSAEPALQALWEELLGYPGDAAAPAPPAVVVPLRLRVGGNELSFISTTTVFGTPLDITLAELALECFFPADAATAAQLQRFAAAG